MRMFLPIKGPGGRALTTREKGALVLLAITLVVCLLTLLAGEAAFSNSPAQNPVLAAVTIPSRLLGAGVVALYVFVLGWCSLLYFKGEKTAQVGPLPGRLFAALGAAAGISGILGVSRLETAGSLGALVGGSIVETVGGGLGLPLLFLMVLVGFSLAAQGSWTALREPAQVPAPLPAAPLAGPFGPAAHARGAGETPLPDDGDPPPEARSLAVAQAMEEIERKGVTIVEMDAREQRTTIGEEVERAPEAEEHADEAEIRQGVSEIAAAIEPAAAAVEEEEPEEEAPAPPHAQETPPLPEPQGDPYDRPGILKRRPGPTPPPDPEDRPHSSFDWRGRPLA